MGFDLSHSTSKIYRVGTDEGCVDQTSAARVRKFASWERTMRHYLVGLALQLDVVRPPTLTYSALRL